MTVVQGVPRCHTSPTGSSRSERVLDFALLQGVGSGEGGGVIKMTSFSVPKVNMPLFKYDLA